MNYSQHEDKCNYLLIPIRYNRNVLYNQLINY